MEIFIILGLILLNGIFSMTEMAMVSARKVKLEVQAEKGSKKAKDVLKIMEHPDNFLSTIQIWITVIGILTGIFSGESIQAGLNDFFQRFDTLKPISGVLSTTVIVIIVTYFTLVLGELVPKRIGLTQAEGIAKNMAPVMNVLSKIMFPFIWLLSVSTKLLVKLLRIKKRDTLVTEEEIRAMIEESAEQGGIEVAEQEMIERVFHLDDRNISSLMTHRKNIFWLNTNYDQISDVMDYVREHPFSVYPVCEDELDHVIGFVRNRDLFSLSEKKTLKDLCRIALFVPESNSAYSVMELFKKTGIHVCFVVDEYGSLQGMVTLNDMFEAIVGDMHDIESTSGQQEIIARDENSYWVDAQIHFYDFLDYFGYDNIPTRFDTLAGFILNELEHIPKLGEKLEWKAFTFEIADMDGQRIDKVLVTLNPVVPEDD
ncbi:MAG: hemolysin family protein [Bacteroidales bacterium]|jgi:putative hemolysin|nr:hemolysin family protein [Bacteroidales bacterium]